MQGPAVLLPFLVDSNSLNAEPCHFSTIIAAMLVNSNSLNAESCQLDVILLASLNAALSCCFYFCSLFNLFCNVFLTTANEHKVAARVVQPTAYSSYALDGMLFSSSHPAPYSASATTALLGNVSSPALVGPVASAVLSISLVYYIFICPCWSCCCR